MAYNSDAKMMTVMFFGGGPRKQPAAPAGYQGPLDLVPGAVIAYGQRAMSAADRGETVCQLFADTDPVVTGTFASDATTGAVDVAAIQAFMTAHSSSGYFAKWVDKGTTGADILGDSDHLTSTWENTSINTLPSFLLGRTQSDTTSQIPFTTGEATIFLVVKRGDAACSLTIGDVLATNPFIAILYNTSNGLGSCDVWDGVENEYFMDVSGGVISANPMLVEVYIKSGAPEFLINNTASTVVPSGTLVGFTTTGVSIRVSESSFFCAEILGYSSALSSQDRAAIRQNIATYYGITLS